MNELGVWEHIALSRYKTEFQVKLPGVFEEADFLRVHVI